MTPASIGSLIGRPIGIDLFAGAGGMSLGFEQAGFDVAAAVEIDPIHAATHEYNFSQCAVLPRSVIGLTGATIRAAAGIGARRVDMVFGGAPCQGFSLIGHRILDDPRNALVREFVRIVAELDATCFVFENVKGLTLGQHRAFLNELIEAFDTAGYEVKLPWRVLDAACFGVPQHRWRLFLYGARKGSPIPDYPAETHRPMDSDRPSPLPPGPDCRGALEGIPDADRFAALWDGDEVAVAPGLVPNAYAREMRGLSQAELGKKAQLQPTAISHFETGGRAPSFDNLRRLADALNVSTDYLTPDARFSPYVAKLPGGGAARLSPIPPAR